MATSEFLGRLEYVPDDWDENDPVDTFLYRLLVNNARHFADEDAPVCASFAMPFGSPGGDRDRLYVSGVGTDPQFPALVWRSAPFLLRQREDGESYRVRMSLTGQATAGTGIVWAVLHSFTSDPRSSIRRWYGTLSEPDILTPYPTLATPTEVNYISQGQGVAYLSAAQFSDGLSTEQTRERSQSTLALEPVRSDIRVMQAAISVFWRGAVGAPGGFRLTGFHASQYVGL